MTFKPATRTATRLPATPRLAARLLLAWLIVAGPTLRAENIVFEIGGTTASNRAFNASSPITYNFGVTDAGYAAELSLVQFAFRADRGQNTVLPVVYTVYDNLGGTGNIVTQVTVEASAYPTAGFNNVATTLAQPIRLAAGLYSVKLTTAATGNNTSYTYKEGALRLLSPTGTNLSNLLYVEDSNSTGTASTTLTAANPVLAMPSLASQSVNFGNFRLGASLSQQVQVTNANFPTSNNYSEALAGTSSTSGTATVTGVPPAGTPLNQGQSTNLTVGLGSATAGPVSGDVNLSFTSVQGSSASPGPFGTNVGTPTIAVSGTGYREAAAGFSTTNASLGRFHVGATNVTGTITLENTQTAGQYSEGLAAESTATSGGASVVSGLPTVASPLAAGSTRTVTLGLASVANVGTGNSGTVTLGLDTSGTGTSGLAAASIGSQLINVSAQGYSGQSVWQASGSGTWGDFDDWDVPGGTPGVDGSLSVNDTATFGSVPTGPTTVNLDGVSPALATLTFANAAASYTIAQGTGGSLTVGTSAATGSVAVTAGSHTISTGLALGRNTSVSTAAGTKLTVSGALTGSNTLTKTGLGELAITGTGSLSGATTVSAGTLRVNGSITSSDVTVASGATLAGGGNVGGIILESGSTLAPGNSPGTITANDTTVWQPGGDYNWQIYNAGGSAGTGWDLLSIVGADLDLTNLSSEARFDVNLWSLSAIDPDVNGNAINFSPSQSYSWTIARVSGGGSILGFSADKFNLNVASANGTTGFSNSLAGGSFSIAQDGSDLNIVFMPVPEPEGLGLVMAAVAGAWMLRRRTVSAAG